MSRTAELAIVLEREGLDAYFACRPISMGYLDGFWEDPHERFLVLAIRSTGEVRMIAPALSAKQASKNGISDIRPWKDGEDPMIHLEELAKDWGLKSGIIAVDDEMPAHMLLSIQETLPALLVRKGQPYLSELRAVKSDEELEKMRKASQIADAALADGIAAIKVGSTEMDVEVALREGMKARGGKPTFCIVGTGAGSAEPHHLTEEIPLVPNQIVLMDFGCSFEGYQSDITRCVCLGTATEEMKSVYRIVSGAHRAGLNALAVGKTGAEVDSVARKVIEDAGYGDKFIHRLGHGIGLEGHELPNLASSNHAPLASGNCVSVEPGVYLEENFGIRIENLAVVTESGHESLNAAAPVELMEIPL